MLVPYCRVALCTAILLSPPLVLSQRSHPFTVEDDIAMTRFSDPRPRPGSVGSEIAQMSPDGKDVAIVTSRGLLATNKIESEISIWKIRSVRKFLASRASTAPQRRVLTRVVSYPHREQTVPYAPVIQDLRWAPDGSALFFRRESPEGLSQLCAASLVDTHVQVLSSFDEDVNQIAISSDTVVYSASHPKKDRLEKPVAINADARVATGKPIFDVLFPNLTIQGAPEVWTMSVLRKSGGGWKRTSVPSFAERDRPLLSDLIPFSLSPDHKKLITLIPPSVVPATWEQYLPALGGQHLRFRGGDPAVMDPRNGNRPQRYTMIDLTTGRQTLLLDAPDGRSLGYVQPRRVIWSPDGRRVLLTNTFMPFEGVSGKDASSKTACGVASVDLPSRNARCLFFQNTAVSPNTIQDVSFGGNEDGVTVVLKKERGEQEIQSRELYEGAWRLASSKVTILSMEGQSPGGFHSPRDAGANVQVLVEQDLNQPPTLWAKDAVSGKKRELWDPNPQFAHVRFAEATEYRWTDKTGYEWNAQLVKPLDYVVGKRYPLIVQLYTFDRGQFVTGGPYPSAFAARELGSAGFFVLLVQKKVDTLSERDPEDHLEAYRSGIESLWSQGLIDRQRVGVIGFSWSCWYAATALVRQPELFAAATIADGLDNSYMQYHFAADAQPIQRQMEAIRGGAPFGPGLKRWLDESPSFQLDRVRAPVRIEAINPASVLQEWELYSSLRMQHKPVDLIYFPDGTHIHQKPMERLESQQGDVDWFRFWLQGFEDPAPAKRDQYERWRELRRQIPQGPPK